MKASQKAFLGARAKQVTAEGTLPYSSAPAAPCHCAAYLVTWANPITMPGQHRQHLQVTGVSLKRITQDTVTDCTSNLHAAAAKWGCSLKQGPGEEEPEARWRPAGDPSSIHGTLEQPDHAKTCSFTYFQSTPSLAGDLALWEVLGRLSSPRLLYWQVGMPASGSFKAKVTACAMLARAIKGLHSQGTQVLRRLE